MNDKETPNKASRGESYKPTEDVALCSAWVTVSNDPIFGVYQDGESFYAKVKAEFDSTLRRDGTWVCECPALHARFTALSVKYRRRYLSMSVTARLSSDSTGAARPTTTARSRHLACTCRQRAKHYSAWHATVF